MNVTDVTLPHDLAAERALLGAVLVRQDAFMEVGAFRPEFFFREAYQAVWRAFYALSERKAAIDSLTLREQLQRDGTLELVGGPAAIQEFDSGVPRSTNVAAYASIVRHTWTLRQVLQRGLEMAHAAEATGADADELLQAVEADIFEIGHQSSTGELLPASELMHGVMNRLEVLLETKTGITGLATGLTDLDHITRGLQPNALVILAARPAMGKTSLVTNIAAHVARHSGPVAFFSLEMAADELLLRQVIGEARLNATRVLGGYLNPSEYGVLNEAVAAVSRCPVWVDDGGERTIHDVRSRSRRLKAQHGLSLVIVDYLQLMSTVERGERRDLEIGVMTRGFKQMAKELQVPVVVLSQLNRGLEARGEKRPTLADLRESGAIEQDADLVVMLYRDEVYNAQSSDRGVAELIIAKHRNGPTGTVRVGFIPEQTRFTNLEERR